MRELSIFVDESGDFGTVTAHAPFYLVGLVIHDQGRPFSSITQNLMRAFRLQQLERYLPVHAAPLIRREGAYAQVDGATRKRVFDTLFRFLRKAEISYKTILIDKRVYGSGHDLEQRIARELGSFIRENLVFFQSYDRVIVYYDRGQKEISRVLNLVFASHLHGVEFRTVMSQEYILFQAADLACTMELVEARRKERGLSKSESAFFGGAEKFKKSYYRVFSRQQFSGN